MEDSVRPWNVIHPAVEVDHGSSILRRSVGLDISARFGRAFVPCCGSPLRCQSELRDQADAACGEDGNGQAAASGPPAWGGQAGGISAAVDPLGQGHTRYHDARACRAPGHGDKGGGAPGVTVAGAGGGLSI